MPVLHYPGAGATLPMTIKPGERQVSIKGSNKKKKREKSGQAARFGGEGGVTSLQPDRFYFVKILAHFVHYKMAK